MAPILTTRQAEELHKSIIAYLTASGLTTTAAAMREEINLSEAVFDNDTAKKYETLLEKKWTSVVRLQKKIMELETRSASLQTELDNVSPAFLAKRNQDPSSWLPRSPPRHSLESHRDTVNAVAFHPVFSSLASGSEDCTIKIWDWEFGELERTIKAHTQGVRDVDFGGPKGNVLLASCSVDMSIKLWDPADGYKNTRTLKGHDHTVNTVRFIPGGNLLVSASGDKTLRVWDCSTGFCVKTIEGHAGWVRDVCPSLDGRWLLSTGNDQAVRLWDVSSNTPKNTLSLFGHENVITCCALAPPTSYQWFAPMAGLKHPPAATSTAEFMASAGRDKTIRLWDARGNCLATLVGHDNWVSAIVFHPGGKYLLSASDDKTVRCWDLSQEGKCVKVLSDTHEQFITALRWADGPVGEEGGSIRCVIATASMDTTVRVFAS